MAITFVMKPAGSIMTAALPALMLSLQQEPDFLLREPFQPVLRRGKPALRAEEKRAFGCGDRPPSRPRVWREVRKARLPGAGEGSGSPQYRRLGCLPADQFIPALMEQPGLDHYVGLLSAARYHGAARHRPQELQVVTGKKRRGIVRGAVRVVFVVRKCLADVPTQPFNTPRGTIRVSTVEATTVDLIGYLHHVGGLEHAATVIAELAELLKRRVQEEARDIAPLIPAMPREGAMRDTGWKLDVNADAEIEA